MENRVILDEAHLVVTEDGKPEQVLPARPTQRDRRLASKGNWWKGRYGHTVGVTKPSVADRKAVARAKAKRARKSRKANR